MFNGVYHVSFGSLPNANFTLPNQGDDAVDSDVTSFFSEGSTDSIVLVSGIDQLNVDAGYVKLSNFGDFVWEDINVNGIQDPGEPGISNLDIYLLSEIGDTLQYIQTEADGSYQFFDLLPGTYTIQLNLLEGYDVSLQRLGSDDLDNDADEFGRIHISAPGLGGSFDQFDIALTRRGSIGDLVFNDLNTNN